MKNSGTEKTKKKSSNVDLRQALAKRIEELTKELETTIQKKEQYQRAVRDLDTRMAQLVGAVDELNKVLHQKTSE